MSPTAADTLFNERVIDADMRVDEAPLAIVYWSPPPAVYSFARHMYRYSVGDGRCALRMGMHARLSVKYLLPLVVSAWEPCIGVALLMGFQAGWVVVHSTGPLHHVAKVISDLSHLAGFAVGLWGRLFSSTWTYRRKVMW